MGIENSLTDLIVKPIWLSLCLFVWQEAKCSNKHGLFWIIFYHILKIMEWKCGLVLKSRHHVFLWPSLLRGTWQLNNQYWNSGHSNHTPSSYKIQSWCHFLKVELISHPLKHRGPHWIYCNRILGICFKKKKVYLRQNVKYVLFRFLCCF